MDDAKRNRKLLCYVPANQSHKAARSEAVKSKISISKKFLRSRLYHRNQRFLGCQKFSISEHVRRTGEFCFKIKKIVVLLCKLENTKLFNCLVQLVMQ